MVWALASNYSGSAWLWLVTSAGRDSGERFLRILGEVEVVYYAASPASLAMSAYHKWHNARYVTDPRRCEFQSNYELSSA